MGVVRETHNILNWLENSKGSWRFRTFSRSLHNKCDAIPSPCKVGHIENHESWTYKEIQTLIVHIRRN